MSLLEKSGNSPTVSSNPRGRWPNKTCERCGRYVQLARTRCLYGECYNAYSVGGFEVIFNKYRHQSSNKYRTSF